MAMHKAPAVAAGWAFLLAAAWMTGSPALPPLVAGWCACLHLVPRAVRRLGPAPRAALLTCGLSILAVYGLAVQGALDRLAPPPAPAAAAKAEGLRDVARSIVRALKASEASWVSPCGRLAAEDAAAGAGSAP